MARVKIDREGREAFYEALNDTWCHIYSYILDFLRNGGTHPHLKYNQKTNSISVKQGVWIDENEADIWLLAEIADEIDNQLNN